MFRQRKLTANSIIQRLAALRFFFIKTLRKPWGVIETPYPKKVLRLPTVLSQEEVAQLINSATTSFCRIILMILDATGARCAEVARLQVRDIDSQRMVVHIQGGKGRKDRDVMLSPILLEALREHWRGLKPRSGSSREVAGTRPRNPSTPRPSARLLLLHSPIRPPQTAQDEMQGGRTETTAAPVGFGSPATSSECFSSEPVILN